MSAPVFRQAKGCFKPYSGPSIRSEEHAGESDRFTGCAKEGPLTMRKTALCCATLNPRSLHSVVWNDSFVLMSFRHAYEAYSATTRLPSSVHCVHSQSRLWPGGDKACILCRTSWCQWENAFGQVVSLLHRIVTRENYPRGTSKLLVKWEILWHASGNSKAPKYFLTKLSIPWSLLARLIFRSITPWVTARSAFWYRNISSLYPVSRNCLNLCYARTHAGTQTHA